MRNTSFVILCLEGAVLSFNVAAAAALIPSIANEFNVREFIAGRVVWLYMLPYGVAALLYGPLVRVFAPKKLELVCFFAFCIANFLAASSNTMGMLLISRALMGFFGASVIPLVLIVIGRHTKTESRGRLVGIFFSATFVASLSGLALSSMLPWRMLFYIPAAIGIVVFIQMVMFLEDFQVGKEGFRINYLAALRNKTVRPVFVYIFFVSFCYHGIQQWLSVYFSQEYHFNQFLISTLITLTSLSGIIGEIAGGYASDRWGRIKTINAGIAVMSLCAFLFIVRWPLPMIVVLMIAWGLGWTINHAGLSTFLTDLPKQFLNESASLNSSVRFIAGGIGASISGIVLRQSFTLGYLMLGAGLCAVLFSTRKSFKF